jgi:hypothetical protein|tara:strand:- start:508 stop:684 length:177 start_codon:yes stop_codon:yes gene_type:complete
MPSYGEKQMPAGRKKMCNPNYYKPIGTRTMKSRDKTIVTDLEIERLEYKGNAVLNANK